MDTRNGPMSGLARQLGDKHLLPWRWVALSYRSCPARDMDGVCLASPVQSQGEAEK